MIDGDARRQQIVIWLGLAVALLSLLLFAYIGHFSRLMSDDYCTLAVGRDLGSWQWHGPSGSAIGPLKLRKFFLARARFSSAGYC